jgi:hypothetical protein
MNGASQEKIHRVLSAGNPQTKIKAASNSTLPSSNVIRKRVIKHKEPQR